MISPFDARQNPHQTFKLASLAGLIALALCLGACSQSDAASVTRADLGQRVAVKDVEYTVLDATWLPVLGDAAESRMPSHEFLLVRVAVSNDSSADSQMATFKLIGGDGSEYGELANGGKVPDWLGLARSMNPRESRQGIVLFDAPRAVYQLQIADEFYDGDTGSAALIHIPIRLQGQEPALPAALE